jgi:hypothetical protein
MQGLLQICNKPVTLIYIRLKTRNKGFRDMTILIALFVVAWVAAALIGTQAYFRGEQTKPIHARNWRSESFEQLAVSITGVETDFGDRVPAFNSDAYTSSTLPTV